MTAPPTPSSVDTLQQAMRRTHRSVLVTLVACGAVVALATQPAVEAGAGSGIGFDGFTLTASALAAVSILSRRRQLPRPGAIRAHVWLSLLSLVAAAGVGVVGVAAAVAGTPRRAALIYVLAGAIFALRPPVGLPGEAPVEPS